jgi:hypothetical protein
MAFDGTQVWQVLHVWASPEISRGGHGILPNRAVFNTSVWLQAGQYLVSSSSQLRAKLLRRRSQQIPAKQKSGCRPLRLTPPLVLGISSASSSQLPVKTQNCRRRALPALPLPALPPAHQAPQAKCTVPRPTAQRQLAHWHQQRERSGHTMHLQREERAHDASPTLRIDCYSFFSPALASSAGAASTCGIAEPEHGVHLYSEL